MSTSEVLPAGANWTTALKGIEGFPAGLPDPAVLARMANEFFTAVGGGESQAAESAPQVTAAPVSPAPSPALKPSISLPSDAVPVAGPTPFSFLKDVRPLFPEPETAPPTANPFVQPLGEFAPAELFDAEAPTIPVESAQPPMPTMPGALGSLDSSAFPTFSFLEEARPLFSYPPAAPGPVPAQPEASVPKLSSDAFDASLIKRDFPILRERVNGRPLVWLDNAATTQKPQSVIDRLSYFYAHENSNVHRAAHELAARATDAYESAREKVRRFLNASAPREIVFVRGATEGINLVAQSWGRHNVHKGDEIVITWLEHHANIVPWQMLCSEKGARLRVAPVDDRGQVILEEYEKVLNPKTRLVSVAQVSNALGTVTPVTEMIEAAHRHGAKVLVDGAQAVSHMRADVQALNCDFYVLSGHKMFAPTGIGVVYGKSEVLDVTPPWQGGGNMIQDVTFEKTIYSAPPTRFEAGTGNIADAVGLGAAIDYLDRVGMANVTRYESEILIYATEALQRVPGLHIIGTAKEKAGVLSFVLDGVPTEEMGNLLNREGIAVRAGHHCAQPILRRFGLERTVRASLALYNTCEDIDALVGALLRIQAGFRS
jgi:cysteine desulfurase/selenocysteine lyase